MSENSDRENWMGRNWNWLVSGLVAILIPILYFGTISSGAPDFAKAYLDDNLFEAAISTANGNENVQKIAGKVDPLDKLSILEGNTEYSENGNHVKATVRIKGEKYGGKMYFEADKTSGDWQFVFIKVRMKNGATAIAE